MKSKISILFFTLLIFIAGCAGRNDSKIVSKATGNKHAVLYIANENFKDEELFETMNALKAMGVNITVTSNKVKYIKGMDGATFKPDIELKNVNVNNYDLFVVIGGTGIFKEWENQELISKVTNAYNSGLYVGAICAAPPVLGKAGLLKNIDATCYPNDSVVSQLKNSGANYIDIPVVVSGRIITGNGPTAAKEFGEKLASILSK